MSDRLVNPTLKDPDRPQGTQKQRRNLFLRDFEEAKPIVRARSNGWCEVEGCDHAAEVYHHKGGRTGAGANHPNMILHCCHVHHTDIHNLPELSRILGYMVRRT